MPNPTRAGPCLYGTLLLEPPDVPGGYEARASPPGGPEKDS